MSAADPPPTLLFFEAPLQVGEGAGVESVKAAGAAKGSADLEDIINSILPPRCVRARVYAARGLRAHIPRARLRRAWAARAHTITRRA